MADPTRISLEQRLIADEARLARDEARLDEEEEQVRESRLVAWFGVGLALVSTVAVVALVLAILALREDVGAMRRSVPSGSVGTLALRVAAPIPTAA